MRVLELFKGTGSFGKVFEKYDMEVISVDIMKKFNPTILTDILNLDYKSLPIPDLITASPPCNTFSKLAVSNKTRDWYSLKGLRPSAKLGEDILYKTLEIIEYFLSKNPKLLFVIENPMAMMRRMSPINNFPRTTTYYCMYGCKYRKPTDFFNNFPRGLTLLEFDKTKIDITELRNVVDLPLKVRYMIPPLLIEDIYKSFISQYGEEPIKINFERTENTILERPIKKLLNNNSAITS